MAGERVRLGLGAAVLLAALAWLAAAWRVPPPPPGRVGAPPPPSRWGWAQPRFSPGGGVTAQLVRALGQAQKTVRVQAYSFTSRPIAEALVAARKRGVDVAVIVDAGAAKERGSQVAACRAGGVAVWLDGRHAIAHNKVVVIDGEVVFSGSFNFSGAAENSNAENSVPILNPEWVKVYAENWELHRSHSEAVK